MNKSELVETVAAKTGASAARAGRHLDTVLTVIEEELKNGGEVNITGFGKFKVNERPAREGRNPQTGEPMQIRASRVPSFSAGNALKKAL